MARARSEYVGRQLPTLRQQLTIAIEAQTADATADDVATEDRNDDVMSAEYVRQAVQAVRTPAEASTRGVLRELFLRRRQLETRQVVPAAEVLQLAAWLEAAPDASLGTMILDARAQLDRAESTVVLHINMHDDSLTTSAGFG